MFGFLLIILKYYILEPPLSRNLIVILGPQEPIDCKTGNWGNWIADVQGSIYYEKSKYDELGNSNKSMIETDNLDEYPEYEPYEDYDNYNGTDEEYENYSDYILDSFDFPPIVNCTCFRTDIQRELQYRKKEVTREGTIGGVPCGTIKESRNCMCLNYGMYIITSDAC